MSDAATISRAEHEAAVATAVAEAVEDREKEIARLHERIGQLQHALWGRRSEKQPPSPDAPFQSALFSSEEVVVPPETDEESEDEQAQAETPARLPKKRSGKPRFGPNVERKIIDIELPEAERACTGCGKTMPSIGFESAERAHHIPARIVVHEERRHKYACGCKQGGVTTAPTVPSAFPKSRVTDELRAHVIVNKFVDHCPYYRQSAMLRRLGYEISDSTLGRLGIEAADRVAPIVVAMREELLASNMLQADETTIPVLKTERAKPGAHRGWLWAYGIPHGSVVFDYTRTRAAQHPSGFLEGYQGILQTDEYEGYGAVRRREGVIGIGCWAHARRRFLEAERVSGRKCRPIIEEIQKLYAVERHARERGLAAEDRAELRRRESKPVLDEIRRLLRDLVVDVRPESPLGDAVLYALNHWDALTGYVEHGEAEIDNNLLENSMRPVALGRKNYLFAGSELGAEAAAILYSLTESCRRLGVNPEAYLVDLLRRLATVDPKEGDAIRALTPARWAAGRQAAAA